MLARQAGITHLTRYNGGRQVVETRMPSDPDGNTLTSYYTATGAGRCAQPSQAGPVERRPSGPWSPAAPAGLACPAGRLRAASGARQCWTCRTSTPARPNKTVVPL